MAADGELTVWGVPDQLKDINTTAFAEQDVCGPLCRRHWGWCLGPVCGSAAAFPLPGRGRCGGSRPRGRPYQECAWSPLLWYTTVLDLACLVQTVFACMACTAACTCSSTQCAPPSTPTGSQPAICMLAVTTTAFNAPCRAALTSMVPAAGMQLPFACMRMAHSP